MSGLFRGRSTQQTFYSGIQIQSTTAMAPVPIVWGRNMITGTCIDYRNFHSEKVGSKGGGKGGLFGGGSQETVYYADIIIALCEGPIADVFEVYQTSFTAISLAQTGLGLTIGNIGQAPTSHWTTFYPTFALGYSGIAYGAAVSFDLGPSATIGSMSFVIDGLRWGTGFNGIDADPALVIEDFLTSTQYGVGFPSGSINAASLTGASGSASLEAYCQAAGLAFSPALVDREPANSILTRWLQILNCAAVWSSGQLSFIPWGDEALTANGWTFTPNLTVQYALNDDSYVVGKGKSGGDPLQVPRSDPYKIDNPISLEIVGRNNGFNTGPVLAFDQTAMDRYGQRVGNSITAREITDYAVAQQSAQLIVQRANNVRRTFTFKLSWEYCILDPMDLVSLTDKYLGLNATVVRITAIEEDDQGILAFTAEEFTVGVGTAQVYQIQSPQNGAPNSNVTPNPVNAPIIFEPPSTLTNGTVQVWAAVSPQSADPNWGGSVVNASFDGTSYQAVGQLNGASTMGVLTANLAAYGGANPDNTNTLSVSLAESGGALLSTTAANAAAGATACYVNGEYIAYTTATLTGPNAYNLTGLYRGLFGVASASHASGTGFALLSGPLFKNTLPASEVGKALWLKFQSFNIFGGELESLSACTAYTYTITGAGLPSGAWTSYAAAWTAVGGSAQPSIGNGALAASYFASGQSVSVSLSLTFGSTTTPGAGGVWAFGIPLNAASSAVGTYLITNGSTTVGSGSAQVTTGASSLGLFDPTLGQVGPSTYTVPSGAVLTIALTYQS